MYVSSSKVEVDDLPGDWVELACSRPCHPLSELCVVDGVDCFVLGWKVVLEYFGYVLVVQEYVVKDVGNHQDGQVVVELVPGLGAGLDQSPEGVEGGVSGLPVGLLERPLELLLGYIPAKSSLELGVRLFDLLEAKLTACV